MGCHVGIVVFVRLQHEIDAIVLQQTVEHPSLDEVARGTPDGEERVVEHDNLPAGPTLLQLRLEPAALGEQVRLFTIAVEQEELRWSDLRVC